MISNHCGNRLPHRVARLDGQPTGQPIDRFAPRATVFRGLVLLALGEAERRWHKTALTKASRTELRNLFVTTAVTSLGWERCAVSGKPILSRNWQWGTAVERFQV